MKRIAEALTDYVIQKGVVNEEDRELYEYGFTMTIEVGLFASSSLLVSLYLHMLMEGILFFLIFAPLRSYAGGLHLDRFHSCFILSCLTFSGILLIVRYIHIPILFSVIALFILEAAVYILYPVDNINREVDDEENRFFKKTLKLFLAIDLLLALIYAFLKKECYVFLISMTFLMIVVTMILGKYKNMRTGFKK